MKLYNTRTKKIENFTSYDLKSVRMYSCGPTVYDYVHIGNLRAFIAADTLKRALLANDYKVTHIMNITDIDDKTINKAKKLYQNTNPHQALQKVTNKYEKLFINDIQKINIQTKDITFIKATESITAIKALISILIEKGFAYISSDGIYFSIQEYIKSGKKYGQLSSLSSLSSNYSRIINDEYDKDSLSDFALWKTAKPNEPSWEFTIDNKNLTGRPGWHIECSVMSTMKLSQPFDIHTGGVDLIFPHHENEIAQSTAGHTNPIYANFFCHSEHLLVEGQKMSKSLGNFFTLPKIIELGFNPLALRLLLLQSHYRNKVDFSIEQLKASTKRLINWQSASTLIHQPVDNISIFTDKFFKDTKLKILKYINDDLNTPELLATVESFFVLTKNGINTKNLNDYKNTLQFIDDLLGLDLCKVPDISNEAKKILKERQDARDHSDWPKSDELRSKLNIKNIDVRDTPNGQIWNWINLQ